MDAFTSALVLRAATSCPLAAKSFCKWANPWLLSFLPQILAYNIFSLILQYKAFYYNNPFGHMATSSWSGDGVRLSKNPTAPYWRVYPTLAAGIKAHVENLKQGKYKLHGVALQKTPLKQLQALQKAGYNVGPDKNEYASKISNVIKQYNLESYDKTLTAMERELNDNNLAFHEQDGITQALHNLFA